MKKVVILTSALILALTMTLTLAACGGSDTTPAATPTPTQEAMPTQEATPTPEPTLKPTPEPPPEPTPESEPKEAEEATIGRIQRGNWNGNIYSSEYLGFQLLVPDDWEINSDENLLSHRGLPEDVLNVILNGEVPEEYWDLQTEFFELSVSDSFMVCTISLIFAIGTPKKIMT